MATQQDYVLKFSAETKQLDSAIEASENAVKDLGTTGQTVVSGLDRITGGLASQFVSVTAGVKKFISGLNLTKIASLDRDWETTV